MPLLKLSYPKWTNLKFIYLALLYSTCVSFFLTHFQPTSRHGLVLIQEQEES